MKKIASEVNVCFVNCSRCPWQCCRRDGGALTARCAKAVASLMMKVVWFSVTNVTSATTYTVLILHWTVFLRDHGSASGAYSATRVVQTHQVLIASGVITTPSVVHAPALKSVLSVMWPMSREILSYSVCIAAGKWYCLLISFVAQNWVINSLFCFIVLPRNLINFRSSKGCYLNAQILIKHSFINAYILLLMA